MILKVGFGIAAVAMLAGCGGRAEKPIATVAAPVDWRRVATPADRTRLRGWRDALTAALAKARASGNGAEIAAQGALFEPDRALVDPAPPAGRYHCRVFKLGARGAATRDFTGYPYFDCQIGDEGELTSFYKTSGTQRPVGLLFPDTQTRAIFLGTLVLGTEARALQYGRDGDRDMAGIVERIGDKRWRIILPSPRFESMLDVIEMVPA